MSDTNSKTPTLLNDDILNINALIKKVNSKITVDLDLGLIYELRPVPSLSTPNSEYNKVIGYVAKGFYNDELARNYCAEVKHLHVVECTYCLTLSNIEERINNLRDINSPVNYSDPIIIAAQGLTIDLVRDAFIVVLGARDNIVDISVQKPGMIGYQPNCNQQRITLTEQQFIDKWPIYERSLWVANGHLMTQQ